MREPAESLDTRAGAREAYYGSTLRAVRSRCQRRAKLGGLLPRVASSCFAAGCFPWFGGGASTLCVVLLHIG